MRAVSLTGLLIFTLGTFAYGALAVMWLREARTEPRDPGTRRWLGRSESSLVSGALIFLSLFWFCCNAGQLLLQFAGTRAWQIDVGVLCLAFGFPPIIMHLEYVEAKTWETHMSAGWRAAMIAAYVAAVILPATAIVVFAGNFSSDANRLAGQALAVGLCLLFVGAAAYAIALSARRHTPRTSRERQAHLWMSGLFGLMILLFLALLAVIVVLDVRMPWAVGANAIQIAAKSLPLIFFFVGSYHENRFHFFDLFVKRGASLILTLGLLAAWFALFGSILHRFDRSWAAPWLDAIVLLPLAVSLPWLYARLGRTLDRRWLGRRFSTFEAITHFFAKMRSASTEAQLLQQAQSGLEDIFGASAVVVLGDDGPDHMVTVQQIPVRASGAIIGRFLLGPRVSEAPYFSQDISLLTSLADAFSHVLENLRLQLREQEQERRARELVLHASRSELKALRAQINPHFLFNALNSIAGLIHREPAVADRTIEQLADVFRYALRGAESEWAVLDDELEFVRAYLEVERARFGPRLQADVDLADDARGARIPTMIVQTLVENAVKHGVASVRGPAIIHVSARHDDGRLVVSVTDNGPGFKDGNTATPTRDGGYGLSNIRQRLDGYFGAAGALEISRDVERQLTIVSVWLPLLHTEPAPHRTPRTTPCPHVA